MAKSDSNTNNMMSSSANNSNSDKSMQNIPALENN